MGNPLLQFWKALKPTPMMKVSDWADYNRFLASATSAEPGKWRTDRTPYLRHILDCLSPMVSYKEIIVQKSVQLGFTEAGLNVVGCFIDIAPSPILYVMPTISMAKGLSKDRVDNMVENCPSLSAKIRPSRERDSGNTTLQKSFTGGVLVLAGSNSGSELRSRPFRVLILDEVDAYPLDVNGEGSPIKLAEARTTTFSNKKVYKLSTPTTTGTSVIEKSILDTDQNKYFVPLPCCGTYQTLEFENLRWEKGDWKNAKYECQHCGELVEERHKAKFLPLGKWEPTNKDLISKEKIGFIINGLYSPLGWMSWAEIAEAWDKSENDLPERITVTNTMLGRTYEAESKRPQSTRLYERREAYKPNTLPAGVCFLTAGVDIQADRIEIEIVGWGKGKESWSIDYRVLDGDTSKQDVWNRLGELTSEVWENENGNQIYLSMMGVDTGYNTTEAYEFCAQYDLTKVLPFKGKDGMNNIMVSPPRQVNISRSGKKVGGVKVWNVNSSMIKSEIYGFLQIEKEPETEGFPAKYCHFPQYDLHFFKMLTAEKLVVKQNKKGFQVAQWELDFQRNEALDCRVYARAAAHVFGMDMFKDEDYEQLKGTPQKIEKTGAKVAPKKKKPRRKSSWL